MSRDTAVPLFPNPPGNYDPKYMADVTRAFAQFAQVILNPGEGRNTFIVLTDLKDNDQGLEPGALYKFGNHVMIAEANIAALKGGSMAISAGTVAVVIS